MNEVTLDLDGPEATRALGLALGRSLPAGACLALEGDLGAGKTTLVRGLAEGLGVDPDEVSSPTYVLMQAHGGGRLPLHHHDAWMDGRGKALLADGGAELLRAADGVAVVEWASRVEEFLPSPRLSCVLEHVSLESRRARLEVVGAETESGAGGGSAPDGLLTGLLGAVEAARAALRP